MPESLSGSTWLTPTLTVLWALYLALLAGWIVLQKRDPVATLSWLFALALLPYIGFLVYYFLGPRRIERQRRMREDTRGDFGEHAPTGSENADTAYFTALSRGASGLTTTTATAASLLIDGGQTYESLLADVARAQTHVHLEYYIYAPDEIGAELRRTLIERARAGVKVRLLLDATGSVKARLFFSELEAAGGEIGWFHRPRFWQFWEPSLMNLRTHRKIVVIDGRIGYTGGINITDDQDERRNPKAYRDLHLRLEGDAVIALQRIFADDWFYTVRSRECLQEIRQQTPAADNNGPIHANVLASGPDSEWEAIHRLHVGLIHSARKRVWLATPYFVPTDAAKMALTSAALAGLDVRLVVPRETDSRLVTLAARSYFGQLLRAGVRIYEYGPRMLHSKAMLVDDTYSIVGSANYDHRSFRLNFEVAVLFDDEAMAGSLERHLESEFAEARRVVATEGKRPLLTQRLPEAVARLSSPLL